MTGRPQQGPTLLDRLDLSLAQRITSLGSGAEPDLLASAQSYHDRLYRGSSRDPHFLAALLRQRGFAVWNEDAVEVLAGSSKRLPPSAQEHQLILGLMDALQMVRDRSSQGRVPDGWFLVELFRVTTRGLSRFRNNTLRVDDPWDAVLHVTHARPAELTPVLDSFDYARRYRDYPPLFDSLHPLRQGFRVLWRFARIAPFPDFNGMIAWLGMCGWLLAKGYPLLVPEASDRELLKHIIAGPPPTRCVQWEARLLEAIGPLH
jgi:hypothetical protein